MMSAGEANGANEADITPEKQNQEAPDPLAEAQREAAQYKDKALRTLAEMENLRKRTEREVAEARLYGNAGFARDVLTVADNLQRALDAIDPELRASGDAKVTALIEGVELNERELLKVLAKHGVKKFSPEGEKFDPNFHQAMFEMDTADLPPGHVAQVIQPGYMLGERILRPALVAVSKARATNNNQTPTQPSDLPPE